MRIIDKENGVGVCRIYPDRFGVHKTVGGKVFRCVPMKIKLMTDGVPSPACGYAAVQTVEGMPVIRGKA